MLRQNVVYDMQMNKWGVSMNVFFRKSTLIFSTLFLSVLFQAHSDCPLCRKIESERAQQQAQKGPQQDVYYDDAFRENFSQVNNGDQSYQQRQMQQDLKNAPQRSQGANRQNQNSR